MTITIADGRGALWQWDTGRRVKITDGADVKQIHYQNRCFGCSVDVDVEDDGTAIIPDELLQDYHTLTAYAYVTDDKGGYTKVQQDFAVYKRPKPSDYAYTPTEHAGFDRLRSEIGDLDDLTTGNKSTIVAAINEAVLYTPQTLTDAQKKQARENIDAADIDFVINGTLNDDALTLDKTYAQIQEAVQAGKSAVLKVEVYGVGFVLPLIGKSSSGYLFATAATVFPTITIQFNAVVGESETVWHTEHVAFYDSNGNLVQNPMNRDPEQPMEIATKQYVDASGVPSVTAADNGKVLRVANGAWAPVDMPEQVQPDWNQNDTTQPDYVKNKPFYLEKTLVVELTKDDFVLDNEGRPFYTSSPKLDWMTSIDNVSIELNLVYNDETSYVITENSPDIYFETIREDDGREYVNFGDDENFDIYSGPEDSFSITIWDSYENLTEIHLALYRRYVKKIPSIFVDAAIGKTAFNINGWKIDETTGEDVFVEVPEISIPVRAGAVLENEVFCDTETKRLKIPAKIMPWNGTCQIRLNYALSDTVGNSMMFSLKEGDAEWEYLNNSGNCYIDLLFFFIPSGSFLSFIVRYRGSKTVTALATSEAGYVYCLKYTYSTDYKTINGYITRII